MNTLQSELIKKLENLPKIQVSLWKNTNLLCVFYKGKEIAHFQSENEIDIRLTPIIIKHKGLKSPTNTTSHLDRSKSSRWILQSIDNKNDISKITEPIQLASEIQP
jgi:hypothetical protein